MTPNAETYVNTDMYPKGITAATSGGWGDAIYGIKVMRTLGIQTLFVKRSFYPTGEGDLYQNIKPLLELNGFEVFPTEGGRELREFHPDLKFNYNMDDFRLMPERNSIHIIVNQYRGFGLPFPDDYREPWLTIDDVPSGLPEGATVFQVTQRWRGAMAVNWRAWVDAHPNAYFIGMKDDHAAFEYEISAKIQHFPTKDFLEVARVIRDAGKYICNQCAGLAISQAIGREYWCAFKPGKSNTKFHTAKEHEILI